jgi:hypothetical protein
MLPCFCLPNEFGFLEKIEMAEKKHRRFCCDFTNYYFSVDESDSLSTI